MTRALARGIIDGGAYLAVIMGIARGGIETLFSKSSHEVFFFFFVFLKTDFWHGGSCPVVGGNTIPALPGKHMARQSALFPRPPVSSVRRRNKQVHQRAGDGVALPRPAPVLGPDETAISLVPRGAIVFTVGGWMEQRCELGEIRPPRFPPPARLGSPNCKQDPSHLRVTAH